MEQITIVTGIWNLNRKAAGEGFKRPFSFYIDNFKKLLEVDVPMIVYIEKQYEHIVWEIRDKENTDVHIKEVEDFKRNIDIFDNIQKIRTNPSWFSQQGWLKESAQATMENYNPMVMSKMFMLNDASIWNPFGTEYFAWIDGGITNTVHEGYFTHDKVLDNVHKYMDKFFFISFPYEDDGEVHGFAREGMIKYAGERTEYVCRAGFFGGHIDYIGKANADYYNLLSDSLRTGYMGTEESVFTLMSYIDPEMYKRFEVESNGLISPFFEHVKNNHDDIKIAPAPESGNNGLDLQPSTAKVALYIIGFNSPKQFGDLIKSYLHQPKFLDETDKYLLDNSTDESTFDEYTSLCDEHGFTRIKKNNIGICGGRQFVAEHFDKSDNDLYIFLEDDMTLVNDEGTCKNGFRRLVPDLLSTAKRIIIKEGYDFMKFSFTEFYGDNGTQWSWYNLPSNVRIKLFPDNPSLPRIGLDKNAPRTIFNNIKIENSIPYADGEIYYCNWPQIVSRDGNKKMFLDTTWGHPHEQTWMSHIYQLTKDKKIRSAILLASPIEHIRSEHYDATLRVES